MQKPDTKQLERFLNHFKWSIKEWNPESGPLVTITRAQAESIIALLEDSLTIKQEMIDHWDQKES
jgi:hypothetical protein